jgi:hypothetical protein
MLLDDGRYGEQRVISKLAAHRATWETSPHQLDNTLKVPLRYSEGMMLGGEPFGLFGPHTGNAFGHLGLINIFAWADPDRDIAVALLSTGKPLLAHRSADQLLREINNDLQAGSPSRRFPGFQHRRRDCSPADHFFSPSPPTEQITIPARKACRRASHASASPAASSRLGQMIVATFPEDRR